MRDPNGGLRPRQLVAWIGTQVPFPVVRAVQGAPLPEMPDVLAAVTITSGPGLSLEGAYDRIAFQVRCRGDQNAPEEGDDMAHDIDAALLTADMPTIDGIPTLGFTRTGSGPTPLDTDDGERETTVCTYMVQAASVL